MTSRIFVYLHILHKVKLIIQEPLVESYLGRCNYFHETHLCLQLYSYN